MRLSILIPTITGREHMYQRLIDSLQRQMMPGVEILQCCDNKELSIGTKRQTLLNSCTSDYMVMVDDDDNVAHDFIPRIMEALKEQPDCVTYIELVSTGSGSQYACHSNKYREWANGRDGFAYVRTPFYKDVIRTSIAKEIGFRDLRYGEDHDFAKRLKASGLIKTEVHIPEVMYYYNAPAAMNSNEHNKRYGIK